MSFKRVLALVLALTMVFSLAMPGTWAFAEEDDGIVAVEDEYNDEGIVAEPEEETPAITEETPAEEPAEEIVVDEQPAEEPKEESEEPEEEEEFDFDELSLEDTDTFEASAFVATIAGSEGYSKQYTNLGDAISEAGATVENYGLMESKITLLGNLEYDGTITNTTVTIEGANKTIEGDVTIGTGAYATFTDLTINGSVIVKGGKLTLTNVTVTGTLEIDSGEATLTGTTDISEVPTSVLVSENGKLNISGGNYSGVSGKGTGNITGGIFTFVTKTLLADGYVTPDFSSTKTYGVGEVTETTEEAMVGSGTTRQYLTLQAATNTSLGTPKLMNDAEYEMKTVGETFSVILNEKTINFTLPNGTYAESSTDNGVTTYELKQAKAYNVTKDKTYESLVAAFNEAADGETVKLLDDADDFAPSDANFSNIEKNITIDLNGKVLTPAKKNITVSGGNVTFKNGKINITKHTSDGQEYVFGVTGYSGKQGFLTFENVEFTGSNIKVACGVFGSYGNKGSVLTLDGCSIAFTDMETDLFYGQTYAPGSNENYINVRDTSIQSSGNKSTLAYAGIITIENSQIDFKSNGGSYGTIHHSNLTLDHTSVSMEINDANSRVDGKWIGLNVTGDGTEVQLKNASTIAIAGEEGRDGVRISGTATYDQDTASGVTLNEKPISVGVAEIGGKQYSTLQNALAAAQDNDTVTLLSDVGLATTLTISKAITLDGNGHTIKAVHGTPEDTESDHFGYHRLLESGAVAPNNYGRSAGRNLIALNAAGTLKNVKISSNGLYSRHLVEIPAGVTGTLEDVELDHATTTGWGGNALHLNGDAVIVGKLTVTLGERTWAAISFNQNNEKLDLTNCTEIEVKADNRTAPQAFILTGPLTGDQVIGLEDAFIPVSSTLTSNHNGFEPIANNAKIGSADAEGTVYNYKVGTQYFETFAAAAAAAQTAATYTDVFKAPAADDIFTLKGDTLDVKLNGKVADPRTIVAPDTGNVLDVVTANGITTYSLVDAPYVLMVKNGNKYEAKAYYATFTDVLDKFEPSGMYISVGKDTTYTLKVGQKLFIKEEGNAKFTANAPEGYTVTTQEFANSTRYALTPITYSIGFNGNGADNGATATMTDVSYDVDVVLTANGFTKTGYHFLGWATNTDAANAKTVAYKDGATVKNLTAKNGSTYTLYAVWEPNTYSFRFNANTGTGTMPDQTFTVDDFTQSLNENKFTKTGYTFDKWTLNADGTGSKFVDKAQIKANWSNVNGKVIDLYAQWTPTEYTITLDTDGGTLATDTTLPYTIVKTFKLPVPTYPQNQKVFQGWKVTTADGSWVENAIATDSDITGAYGDTTLTAQWTDAEAKMTTKGNRTIYYDTIEDAIADREANESWFDEAHPIVLNADNVTFNLENGKELTIDLDSHSGTFTVTPANQSGTTSDKAPVQGYYALPAINNDDGTVTYKTATYIGYVKKDVNTYNWAQKDNGEWEKTSTETVTTYTLYDTFENAAAAAKVLATDVNKVEDRVYGETIKTIVLLRNNDVPYQLNDGDVIVVDRNTKFSANCSAAEGCAYNSTHVGNVYTLRAAKKYSINYNVVLDGKATTTDLAFTPTSYNVFDADFELTAPTWEGHTFTGWTWEGQTEPTKTYTVHTDGTAELTVTANFTTNVHKVTFTYDGKTFTKDVAYGAAVPTPTDVEKTGYTFNGWTPEVPETMPDEDQTFTGSYTIHRANIGFWSKGLEKDNRIGKALTNVAYNTKVTFPTLDPIPGKTFLYWEYDGKQIDPDNFLMPDTVKTIRIYAVYSSYSYAVSFVMFDKSVILREGNAGAALEPATNTDVTGYIFKGWIATATDAPSTDLPATFGENNMPATVTYTGVWEKKTANIGFWNAGETPNTRISVKTNVAYDTKINFPTAPNVTGKTFSHWTYNGKQIDHTNFTMPDPGKATAIRFYAQYTDNDYSITWQNKTSDGTVTVIATDTGLHFGDEVTVHDAPEAEANYSFVAWEYDHELGEGNTMPASDVVATATWKGKNVTTTWLDGKTLLWENYEQEYGKPIEMPDDETIQAVLERKKAGFALDENDLWTPAPDKATGDIVFQLNWKQLYTVTFVTEGAASGSYVTIGTYGPVMDGKTVPLGADPIAEDASGKQASWLIDGEPFVFNVTPITKNTTLVATWGGEEPVDEEYADFTYNMSLTDSLNLKYYVRNVRDGYDYDKFVITVTVDGGESQPFVLSNKDENILQIASLDARRMTDNIHVVVTYDGKEIKSDDYTIQAYCEAVLAQSTSDQLNALVNAVLVYGANAQVTLNYKPTELPIEPYDVSGVAIPSMKAVKRGQATGVTNIGDRIRVEATITLDVVVQLADGVDPATIKAYVDSETDARTLTKLSGNLYYVSIPVSALRLDTNHTVTLEAEDGSYAMYSGSALAPLSRAANDLAKAVYAYFNAAQNYYGSF